ncbi:hypothetical protein UG55_1006198 [Frankia sp. EI5c]|nr:hypothetical protein UG55_1006198 [Frankia sp. EI5c]
MAAIGCLVACGNGGKDGAGGSGGVRTLDGPVTSADLSQICDGETALAAAPPYAGPAPHPVMVLSQRQGNDPTGPTLVFHPLDRLGEEEHDAFLTPVARIQLVACAERADRAPTDVVCRFDLGVEKSVPFFRTSYRITVREAHTGKVVGTVPVNPAAAGCPTAARVSWGGAEVFSAPTDPQFVSALRAFAYWDGTGTPPQLAEPADIPAPAGAPVVAGSVHLTTAPGVDPTSPVVRDHLAFWAAFAGAQEADSPDFTALSARTDGSFFLALTRIVDQLRGKPGRSNRGPLHLLVTGVSQQAGVVAVDSCVDETERQEFELSEPTGDIGLRYQIRVNLEPGDGGYLATGFADPQPAGCPPPAGRVG